jgi:uncharacterized membrane protein (GlpM family)
VPVVAEVLLKGLAGGALVTAFAWLGERLRPQSLAGVLAAAPSVALASLAVTIIAKGPKDTGKAATGMLIGAAAMGLAALVAIDSVRRFRALRGSMVAVAAWVAAAGALYGVVLR